MPALKPDVTNSTASNGKKGLLILLAGCVVLLAGCKPCEAVYWSPDGKHMAVLASDGVRIGDANGTLPDRAYAKPSIFRWLPDSKHALIITTKATNSWNSLKQVLTAKQCSQIKQEAEKLWTAPQRHTAKWQSLPTSTQCDILVYLSGKYGERNFRTRLPEMITHYTRPYAGITTLQSVDCLNDKALRGQVLWQTAEEIRDLRISPSGAKVALSLAAGFGNKLVVLPVKGGMAQTVVETNGDFPDWSHDGTSLFYITYPHINMQSKQGENGDDSIVLLATLNRRRVTDERGSILAKLPNVEKLAEVPASETSRVRSMPDGSVIFNSQRRIFPSIKKENTEECLFRLSADFKSIEALKISDPMPTSLLDCFEPNQDGTKIAVPGSKGEITVLDLQSGHVVTLEKAGPEDLAFVPQWRNNDDICFPSRNATRSANGHDIEAVLQSISDSQKRVVLSNDWPVKKISFLKDPEKAPTQKPAQRHLSKRRRHRAVNDDKNYKSHRP